MYASCSCRRCALWAPKCSSPSTTQGKYTGVSPAKRGCKAWSPRKYATTTLVSTRTLPTMFIDLFAAFLDRLLHGVGVFRRQASERAGESRFPFYLADPLEPVYEIGGHLQPGRRQQLQILDDVFERAHNFKVHRHDPSGKQQYPRTM